MKTLRRLLLLPALLATFHSHAVYAGEDGVSANSIKFGQVAPLEGAAAALGTEMQKGLLAAFNEANVAGGINGRKIELVSKNDSYEPEKSVAALTDLIDNEKVFAIAGPVGTPTSNAMLPVSAAKNIPLIGAFTGAKSLRDAKWKHVVNLRASYEQETEAWISHLTTDLDVKRVAVFYQDDAFGQAGLEGVRFALSKRGMKTVAEASYPRNTKDIKGALEKIKQANPEAVAMIAAYGAASEFIREAKKENLKTKFLNISFVGGDALAKELGPDAAGVIVTQVVPSYYEVAKPFVVKYWKALKQLDSNAKASFTSFEGYAVGRLIVEALKTIKGEVTRQSFMSALSSGNYDLDGFKLDFSNGRNQGSDAVFLTEIHKDGVFVTVDKLSK